MTNFLEALRSFTDDLRQLGYEPPEFMAFDSETLSRIRTDVPTWAATPFYSDPAYAFREINRIVRQEARIEGVTIGKLARHPTA